MDYLLQKLSNGLRVILVPMKNTNAVTILVEIATGSKYENKRISGISHFLEHMMFKGTKNRPGSLEISRILDSIGAEFNAFTGKETTSYYVKAPIKYFDTALDILSDIYLNSLFNEKELEKEKGVIIEEINMYKDLPHKFIFFLFDKLLYGNQPAGWSILGEKENILKIRRKDLLNYFNNHYSAQNTVICVAGGIPNNKSVFEKIANYFDKIRRNKPPVKKKVIEKQKKPRVLLEYRNTDQVHLAFGLRTYNIFDERKYPVMLTAVILGGNMSSRLFQKLRTEFGISYYLNTNDEIYTDSGYLATFCGLNINQFKIGLKEIINEHNRLALDINEKELKMAKEFLKGRLTLNFEDSLEVALFYASQEILLNKILQPKDLFKKIDSVQIGDIKTIMKEINRIENRNLAIIGPFKNKKEFDHLLKL